MYRQTKQIIIIIGLQQNGDSRKLANVVNLNVTAVMIESNHILMTDCTLYGPVSRGKKTTATQSDNPLNLWIREQLISSCKDTSLQGKHYTVCLPHRLNFAACY